MRIERFWLLIIDLYFRVWINYLHVNIQAKDSCLLSFYLMYNIRIYFHIIIFIMVDKKIDDIIWEKIIQSLMNNAIPFIWI